MIRIKNSTRLRITLTAALAIISVGLLTACGSSSQKSGETAGSQAENISAQPEIPETGAADEVEEEETDDFFSIMQKFSAGEIDAVPFDELTDIQDEYGVVFLAEETESGLTLYGYVEPESQYTGVYVVNTSNTVNAFPDLVYTTDALIPPTLQWDAQEKILGITSYESSDADGQTHSFKQMDSGLLVSLDEEPEEEETTEEEVVIQSDITTEEAAEGVAAFLELVKAGDKEAIAGMISYPSQLTVPSGEYTVNSPEEFLPYYEELFTGEFTDQLLAEEPDAFLHNGLISFGAGEIWFIASGEDNSLRITAINGMNESSLR